MCCCRPSTVFGEDVLDMSYFIEGSPSPFKSQQSCSTVGHGKSRAKVLVPYQADNVLIAIMQISKQRGLCSW